MDATMTVSSRPKRAIGSRGSWFASVDGEKLPCFHKFWVRSLHHHAKCVSHSDPRNLELVAAIKRDPRIILTKDEVVGDGKAFKRTGYIAVYRIANIVWRDEDLEFDLVEKLELLRG